jgi:gliding motility-associated-like protein
MNLAGVATGVKSFIDGSPRKTGCIPATVDFRDTLAQGTKYIWHFGDGSPDETTTTANISHTYANIGSYTVRLVSVDSSTCNITDTSYTTINIRQDIAKLDFNKTKLPPCTSLTYRFDNLSVPPNAPGKPFTAQSFRWDFGDGTPTVVAGTQSVTHTYASRGTYNVKLSLIDTNYCNYPDDTVKQLRISDDIKASFTTPPFGCAPYTPVINNTTNGGEDFIWDFGDGTTSTATTPTHTYTVPGIYTIKLKAIDTTTCNKEDSVSFTITVSGSPTALYSYSPNPPQVNTAVNFTNASLNAISYLWKFGDGDTLNTIRRDTTVQHFYNVTKTFNSCLIAYNQYGCTDTFCLPIVARVIPALDVPNIFTPNGDGVNDQVYVLGFAIAKMTWRIYNRWGTLVFTTTDRHQGWDGKYKGVLQPQEVYTYTLEVEFSDGTRTTKTGDITLLK